MKYVLRILLVSALIIMLCSISVSAGVLSGMDRSGIPTSRLLPYCYDEADLLYDIDEEDINNRLENMSQQYSCDFVVCTVQSLSGYTAEEAADDFYDYNGYGYGADRTGILFFLSMNEREWHITTTGKAITYFTDYGIDQVFQKMKSYLANDDYYGAFASYIDTCDDFMQEALAGNPYDVNNRVSGDTGSSGLDVQKLILYAVIFGLFCGLIGAMILKGQLKSVRFQAQANNYLRPGSFFVTLSNDFFLYRNVTKSARSDSSSGGSSTHSSSSGSSHGGGGGHF